MMQNIFIGKNNEKYIILEVDIQQLKIINTRYIEQSKIIAALKSGVSILNLELINNRIRINGKLERYNTPGIIIIARYKDNYVITDRSNIWVEHISKLLNQNIINGKVVNANNKYIISSIYGNYIQLEENDNNEKIYRQRGKRVHQVNTSKERGRANNNRISSTGPIQDKQAIHRQGYDRTAILHALTSNGYKANNSPEEFYKFIQQAKEDNPFGDSVDLHTIEEYSTMNNITFSNGMAGISVKQDGNIVSVFKHPKCEIRKYMESAMLAAVLNGGIKLDCYSINSVLPTMYCKSGFIPVCRIKFNREFAPEHWNYEQNGEPDIVFMMYCGDAPEIQKYKYNNNLYPGFSTYLNIPLIEDSDTEDAYTLAERYRDKQLEKLILQNKQSKVEDSGGNPRNNSKSSRANNFDTIEFMNKLFNFGKGGKIRCRE